MPALLADTHAAVWYLLTVRRIPRDMVSDPADRIIAATALHFGIPLVTRDQRIQSTGLATIW